MKASGAQDFDFLMGDWRVRHRRLNRRLAGDRDWREFDGMTSARKILGGCGNIDDNWLDFPGGAYRAVTLRSFNPATNLWSIWWLDGRAPDRLDVPMIGAFEKGVGSFFADDVFAGAPVRIRFIWTATGATAPQWEQAYSNDGGASWETNWIMNFQRH